MLFFGRTESAHQLFDLWHWCKFCLWIYWGYKPTLKKLSRRWVWYDLTSKQKNKKLTKVSIQKKKKDKREKKLDLHFGDQYSLVNVLQLTLAKFIRLKLWLIIMKRINWHKITSLTIVKSKITAKNLKVTHFCLH